MNDEIIERIHLKLAFLERANSELSDVVFRHEQEIQALTVRIREVAQLASAAQDAGVERGPDDERPPHY